MAEPPKNDDRAAMKKILLPLGGVALLVVLVAVLASLSGGSGRAMSDGSNGTENDPDLRPISSGVQFRIISTGNGPPAPPGARVKVNYTGWLTNGSVFDSSTGAVFNLPDLVAGWQEGIPGMKVGEVRKLVIAPEKGYGSKDRPKIPGNSTLIFEIVLAEIMDESGGTTGKAVPQTLSDGTKPTDEDPNLIALKPGLHIRDIKEGTGNAVPPGSKVKIHYTGWLKTTGKAFDSSYKTGQPAVFSLSGLIKGWQDGIPGMKPGGVRKLVIAPELGYGMNATGDIPPNSTLVFEVELIGVP